MRSQNKRKTQCICARRFIWPALAASIGAHADIVVNYDGPPSATTCTLAQAIRAANAANSIDNNASGSSTPDGNCVGAVAGPNTITLDHLPVVALTSADNYWYGPNALPPIASDITISAVGDITTIRAVHVGDPAPSTPNAFRLFYVSGGLELPMGSLTISNAVLQGGYAKGGDSDTGGGGAGMGGAIFNQGAVTLSGVALVDNVAQGGSIVVGSYRNGGGGMGQDGGFTSGGGFGGTLVGSFGGSGSAGSIAANGGAGGGGGGFLSGSNAGAAANNGGPGGGVSALGGAGAPYVRYGGAGNDGGGGGAGFYANTGGSGGGFGNGGSVAAHSGSGGGGGGGGGVGGGGGPSALAGGGGGGGFGGGGGGRYGPGAPYSGSGHGGFGGGCALGGFECGGFGGGQDSASSYSTGGAGIGGAIFNHTGTVRLLNVVASRNAARGGAGHLASGNGSGLGAALFNLNGNVTIDFSTLAGNSLSGNNAHADALGPEDGSVYSVAYGNKIQDGSASSASLTIHNSIVYATDTDGGANSDVSVNLVDGANTNTSVVTFNGLNFVGKLRGVGTISLSGTLSTADPLLGPLSLYSTAGNLNPTPVLPIGSNSPAYNVAPDCLEADGSTILTVDIVYTTRPFAGACDVGAVEFNGDYIFADGFSRRL